MILISKLSRWHWDSSLIIYNFESLFNYWASEKFLYLLRVPFQDRRGRSKDQVPNTALFPGRRPGKERNQRNASAPRTDDGIHPQNGCVRQATPPTSPPNRPPRPAPKPHTKPRNPTRGTSSKYKKFLLKKRKKNWPHPPRATLYSHIEPSPPPPPPSENNFCVCEEQILKASSFIFLFLLWC